MNKYIDCFDNIEPNTSDDAFVNKVVKKADKPTAQRYSFLGNFAPVMIALVLLVVGGVTGGILLGGDGFQEQGPGHGLGNEDAVSFEGVVTFVNVGGGLLVDADITGYDKFWVSGVRDTFYVGDHVKIFYDGMVLDSAPAQITALNIELISRDRRIGDYYAYEWDFNKTPAFYLNSFPHLLNFNPDDGNITVYKDGSINDGDNNVLASFPGTNFEKVFIVDYFGNNNPTLIAQYKQDHQSKLNDRILVFDINEKSGVVDSWILNTCDKFDYDMFLVNGKVYLRQTPLNANSKDQERIGELAIFDNTLCAIHIDEDGAKHILFGSEPENPNFQKVKITEWDGIAADALELIYQEGDLSYFLSSIRSHLIMLRFEDDTEMSLKDALAQDKITIHELIGNGLDVVIFKEPPARDGDYDEVPAPAPGDTVKPTVHGKIVSVDDPQDGVYGMALEYIAEDGKFTYYLSSMRSGSITLTFEDGTKMTLKEAMEQKLIVLGDLINCGLDLYMQPKLEDDRLTF